MLCCHSITSAEIFCDCSLFFFYFGALFLFIQTLSLFHFRFPLFSFVHFVAFFPFISFNVFCALHSFVSICCWTGPVQLMQFKVNKTHSKWVHVHIVHIHFTSNFPCLLYWWDGGIQAMIFPKVTIQYLDNEQCAMGIVWFEDHFDHNISYLISFSMWFHANTVSHLNIVCNEFWSQFSFYFCFF